MTDDGEPEVEEVVDALFETLAALTDLQERLVGGAQRSAVPPEQVFDSVWSAYDLEEASDVLDQTGYDRPNGVTPEDFAVTERVQTDTKE